MIPRTLQAKKYFFHVFSLSSTCLGNYLNAALLSVELFRQEIFLGRILDERFVCVKINITDIFKGMLLENWFRNPYITK